MKTKKLQSKISLRQNRKDVGIIATGGQTSKSIKKAIDAGANAISYTPPTTGELFKEIMRKYRNEE